MFPRDFTLRRLAVCYRRFGTTYHSPFIPLATITISEKHLLPTPFPIQLRAYGFLAFCLDCLALENWTNRSSRNVRNKIPINATQNTKRAQAVIDTTGKASIYAKQKQPYCIY